MRGSTCPVFHLHMADENKVKLHRFSIDCSAIDVVTFDDLLRNATDLYEAILPKGTLK
jgi:hypothetical protein